MQQQALVNSLPLVNLGQTTLRKNTAASQRRGLDERKEADTLEVCLGAQDYESVGWEHDGLEGYRSGWEWLSIIMNRRGWVNGENLHRTSAITGWLGTTAWLV
jgi:hypothetical protein